MGLILGALAGGAQAVDQIATENIKSNLETDRDRIRNQILEDREKAREERAVAAKIAEEKRQAGPEAREIRKAVAQGTAEDALEINRGLINSRAGAAEEEYDAGSALRTKKQEDENKAKASAEVSSLLAKATPEALAAAKAYAAATRDPMQQRALNLQIQKAEAEINEGKEQSAWRKEFSATPKGDPKRAALEQKGVDMGWIKVEPNDISTTTTRKTMDAGGETSVAVTQKGRASEQAGKRGSPKPGDVIEGFRFKGGNPKDKNSWEKIATGAIR